MSPKPCGSAAMEALARLGGDSSVALLQKLADADPSANVRKAALIGLVPLDPARAAQSAVKMLADAAPGDDITPVLNAFVARKDAPEALAAALSNHTLPRDVAKLGQRVAKAAGQPSTALIEVLARAGSLDAPTPPPNEAEMAALVADVAAHGDQPEASRYSDVLICSASSVMPWQARAARSAQVSNPSAPVPRLITSSTRSSSRPRPSKKAITPSSSPPTTAACSPASSPAATTARSSSAMPTASSSLWPLSQSRPNSPAVH